MSEVPSYAPVDYPIVRHIGSIKCTQGNGITDILFANNIFNAYNPRFCSRYARFLTQADGSGIHTPSPVAADSAGLHPGNVRHADAQEHHVPSADSAFSNRQKENTQPKAEADSTGNDI